MSSEVKQLMYALKLFRVTAGSVHSFRIRRKEALRIMYPKYPVLDPPPLRIIWINNQFLDFSKETKDPFSDLNTDVDFSTETHP